MVEEQEPFALIKHLGSGGFAQTWLAEVRDRELRREWGVDQVAVKIPLTRQKQKVLKKEVEMNVGLYLQLTEMEQRNIVKYLGFEIFQDKLVMVMEYVSGGNLRHLMGQDGAREIIGTKKAIKLAKGILNGLDIIHRRHIIHRDIKPENILMEGETPKIADMGLGRILRPEELATTRGVGTILYMAPEILFGKPGTTYMYNADIWSFGVMFYEMLCFQLPFGMTAQSPLGVLTSLIQDETVPLVFPEQLDIPPGLGDIISRCLLRDPVRRYKTAREILSDLKELSQGADEAVEREIGLISQMLHDPGKASEAEARLREIMKKHPDSSRIYLYFGEFYNRCGNHKKAIEMFKAGVEKDPDNALLRWDLAIAYQKNGDLKEAVAGFKEALNLGLEKSLERYARTLLRSLEGKV